MSSILRSVKRGDILSLVVIVASLLGLLLVGWRGDRGDWVEIRVGDALYRYELDSDRVVEWHTQEGGHGKVEIRQGRVRMLESSCRDQICVHKGWIYRTGDAIICMPNKVMIIIRSQQKETLDGITE